MATQAHSEDADKPEPPLWNRLIQQYKRNAHGYFEHTKGCTVESHKVCTCGLLLELAHVYHPWDFVKEYKEQKAAQDEELKFLAYKLSGR
jgi:hypothetical protein